MTDFLHGVETVDVSMGTTQVREIRSSVIGLVGTAPEGEVDTLTICASSTDDAQFGQVTNNHTIPRALRSLRKLGAGIVLVIRTGTTIPKKVIGDTDIHGKLSGIKLFQNAYSKFGFEPKILIAPGYSSAPAVASALESMAIKVKGMAYVDLPLGLTRDEAIASRGGVNQLGLNIYESQSTRVRFCYPHRKVFDPLTNGVILEPLSIFYAGIRAKTDRERGWWVSSSNKAGVGTLGLEREISARLNDPTCDANLLNAAGFSTVFRDWGTGYLSWGNRTAAYPVNNSYDSFEQVQRTKDMIELSVEQSSLPFVDSDIEQPQIEAIVAFVGEFIRTLIMRKALVGGKAFFDKARNPADQLSQGIIRIGYIFTPKFPMEHIIYERDVTGEYLLDLKSVNMGAL